MKRALRFVGLIILLKIAVTFLIEWSKTMGGFDGGTTEKACVDTLYQNQYSRLHQRSWISYTREQSWCMDFITHENQSAQHLDRRNHIIVDPYLGGYESYWTDVYRQIVLDSRGHLNDLLDSIRVQSKDLQGLALAEFVVSFVQDIPYSYVVPEDCGAQYDPDTPCVPNVRFGILSPYEFLHTESGDCDTRALLIYELLRELGFDPMIVISRHYAHAMLALNYPATGDYLTYQGKRYYFWETTARGWKLGMLPPDNAHIPYWKTALVDI
jgi:hypothetical protein